MSQEYGPPPAPTSRPARRWHPAWLAVVPVVWAAAAVGTMRPDAIVGGANVSDVYKTLLYDESDLTALALRGANADMGRRPGRRDEPLDPVIDNLPVSFVERLDGPPPPLADRYYLEYPTPALGLFWLGFAVQPGETVLPPVVADAQQFSVAFFHPRTAEDERVWSRLGRAVRFYIAVMAAGLAALIVVLARGYGPGFGPPGPVWLAVLPGAVFFSVNRFDVLPALATALSFAALGRGRRGWAGAFLAAGVLLKVYPVLFAPVVLRHLGPARGVRWLLAFTATLAAGFGLAWAATDWQGVVGPIQVQLSRPLERESWIYYGRLLPMSLGEWKEGRLGVLAVAVLLAAATRPAGVPGVLRRCGVVLVVFTGLAVFWSPQWIVWFLPLVVPVARGRRVLVWSAVALDVLNYFSFPILFWLLYGGMKQQVPELLTVLVESLIYARAAAWLALAGGLIADEWRACRHWAREAAFRTSVNERVAAFVRAAAATGVPRGLTWLSAEPAGEPLFVRDTTTGDAVALLLTQVRFEPVPGSDLEDVPQAREPRPVTALFVADGRGWRSDGRAVFNLSPAEVVERSGGRYSKSHTAMPPESPPAARRVPSGA